MKTDELYRYFLTCDSISTDTRNISENCIFFALKGDHFNANTFAEEALNKGARYVVIDEKKYLTDENKMFLVDDTLKALQDLAQFHRAHLGLPIIALTGSNGKTTTKELIHQVLSKKYQTKATKGNLNNHIGVPLTLLSFDEDTDIGIVEMGANHQKEIAQLSEIAMPDFGYITNFGRAHLEGFGGYEGVIKGKSELYNYLREHQKTAFINLDDALQVEKSEKILSYSFSTNSEQANIYFSATEAQPMASVTVKNVKIHSNLTGLYNIPNLCAAISIGLYFNIELKDIKEAIEEYIPANNRSQWTATQVNKILLDAYNANPSSMKVAIENFAQLQEPNKIMILGDMFELGNESQEEHKIIKELAEQQHIPTYFVGKEFYELKNNNNRFFKDYAELSSYLSDHNIQNSTILIKGSRGMSLERILPIL